MMVEIAVDLMSIHNTAQNAYVLKEVEVAVEEQQHLPELHTTSGGCNQGWIGDGYCDDVNNNLDCTYDGGDCCLDYVYEDYCDECLCLECHSRPTP